MAKLDILKGIRVVDFTMWAFVPSAGGVLAHWGADVIKIEHPRNPDPMRAGFGNPPGSPTSLMYKHYNRGKRGIALDLSMDEGRAILHRLVERADVFLTSFLTETRKKLKIDVEDIRRVNSRIIYAKGTGRGPRGPLAERGGYDGATWWGRGSLQDTAMRAAGLSEPPGGAGHGDGMCGHTLAGGICAALLHRALTGKSAVVDGSLMGTAVWFNGPAINEAASGQPRGSAGPRAERNPLVNNYKTKDPRWLNLCMLSGDRDWHDLVKHLGRPDLATDPRFAKAEVRAKHHREANEILDQVFAQRTFKEWQEILKATLGVWEPVQTPAEILEDVQTLANGFVRKAKYPDGSEIPLVVPGALFDQESGEPMPAQSGGSIQMRCCAS